MAKPFMSATRGSGHKLHGLGREDIDARCLGWRPFVLEITEPKKRLENEELKSLQARVNKDKRIKIRKMRFSNIGEVRRIKEARVDKTYKCVVVTKKRIERKDLGKLKALVGIVRQRTPLRVVHRRADIARKRTIKTIKTRFINGRKFEMTLRTETGTYIKEFITGDRNRTRPSISEALGVPCECKELDVVRIYT